MTFNFRAFLAGLLLLAAAVFGFTSIARAGDAQVSWVHPTQFEDGTALAVGQIERTRIEWGTCAGSAFGVRAGDVSIPAPATSTTITGLAPGTWCFRAYTKALPAFGGLESVPTAAVSKTIPFPAPKPPVLTVTIPLAYEINAHPVDGVRLGRAVGMVPLGTVCGDAEILTAGRASYHEVPLDAVTLTKMPKSAIVVAACRAQS